MGLIPIPHEKVIKGKEKTSKCPRKILNRLRERLALKGVTLDKKIIEMTCLKLFEYSDKGKNNNLKDIKNLLNYLERSILSIQRHKKKLVENQNKKLSKKKRHGKD